MITRIGLKNYRSHQQSDVPLQPVTLLVGAAGSGKSNVFRALQYVQNSIHHTLPELFPPGLGEFQWVLSRWAGLTDPLGFQVDLEGLPGLPGSQFRYGLDVAEAPDGLYVLEETLQQRTDGEEWRWLFKRSRRPSHLGALGDCTAYDPTLLYKVWHRAPDVDASSPAVRATMAVAGALSRFGYYHLEVSRLKTLGSGEPSQRIGYNGDGLPDFIAWSKSVDGAGTYDKVLREMRDLLPDLDAILVTQTDRERAGMSLSFRGQRGYIAAPDLSDGTVLTLGLLSILNSPRKPSILCLEEPECGLHPRRLQWLFDRLVALAFPDGEAERTQVILSTHSPYLVDLFRDLPESVLVVEQREGRSSAVPLARILDRLHLEQPDRPIGHEWATGLYENL